ncbi:hypothetical protein PPL_03449 [Heterostelium album PN500]|uniref:tRNA (uracil-O(2)-)-methyltransferase n=1 Tax=Heterostelium pallidum (strain ATCC 26659 / Pp 5 / PN500) TaxID=670386 RepID=D3B4X3_HETP5|nr:hypothetical protein PPL_03449 [Heterostelium album PN500]EFA84371.1 hypothetical protein PPL_03449 [Heterostelium album PN500]|eukprot:XP_020436486.1 hypothetical protein PPL_03449 [Heterostelium album PN500]
MCDINNKDNNNEQKWESVESIATSISLQSFWFTMEKWTLDPQHIMKPVKRYQIKSRSTFDIDDKQLSEQIYTTNDQPTPSITTPPPDHHNHGHGHGHVHGHNHTENNHQQQQQDENEESIDYQNELIESIVFKRHLIPRLAEKDNTIDDSVTHSKSQQTSTFKPLVPEDVSNLAEYLPFYYPKVKQFRFRYIKNTYLKVDDNNNNINQQENKNVVNDNNNTENNNNNNTNTTDNNNNNNNNTDNNNNNNNNNNNKRKSVELEDLDLEEEGQKIHEIRMEVIYLEGEDQDEYKEKLKKICFSLLEKLNKWGVGHEAGYKKRVYHDCIIPKDVYLDNYERLKSKYKNWAVGWEDVTKTDPQKFVFEDIAIAAYIISLFHLENQDRNTPDYKQSFVDLGCGNGFLVNILNLEGYPGIGIDLRCRKVWKKYDESVQKNLIEHGIQPKDQSYTEYDWIIGNHSDELTPWIPYIASKSKKQRFFLLPCCFFNFMNKFQDNDKKIGQYMTYLNYIERVSNQCGFNVIRDAMRIPSTKNVVFISSQRSPDITEEQLEKQRQALLVHSNFKEFTLRPEQSKYTPKKRYRPGEYNPHLGIIMGPKVDKKKNNNQNNNNQNKNNNNNNQNNKNNNNNKNITLTNNNTKVIDKSNNVIIDTTTTNSNKINEKSTVTASATVTADDAAAVLINVDNNKEIENQ